MSIPPITIFGHRGGACSRKSILNQYPEFVKYLDETYPEIDSFAEKCYLYFHNLIDRPKCPCGSLVKFFNFNDGYAKYCSSKCAHNDESVKQKIKLKITSDKRQNAVAKRRQTLMDKYGCLVPQSTKEKYKETCRKKYGCDNAFQSEEIKKQIIDTNLVRYGDTHPMKNAEIRSKHKQTMLDKYGVENIWQLPQHTTLIDPLIETELRKRSCPHPECDKCIEKWYETKDSIYYDRNQNNTEQCTRLLPLYNNSPKDTSIELFVQSILTEHKIDFIKSDRTILNPRELDIYIPLHNLAIECNGIYWHDHDHAKNDKHWLKYKDCKRNNIQLLTIWEDQIYRQPDIVRSIILSRLGIYERRIYARCCEVRYISKEQCSDFLQKNHLQGDVKSSIRLGLFYNDELVSCMTFGLGRKCLNSKDHWELYRYCSKINTQVIGGSSRLFKRFVTTYNPTDIVSFASNDISDGSMYDMLGFVLEKEWHGSYWYINKNTLRRYHRYNFTKYKLVQLGANPELSETEIMKTQNYLKIFDSGQKKYRWTKTF